MFDRLSADERRYRVGDYFRAVAKGIRHGGALGMLLDAAGERPWQPLSNPAKMATGYVRDVRSV